MRKLRPPPGFEGEALRKESSAMLGMTSCWHGALVPQPINWGLGRPEPPVRPGTSQGGEVEGLSVSKVTLTGNNIECSVPLPSL